LPHRAYTPEGSGREERKYTISKQALGGLPATSISSAAARTDDKRKADLPLHKKKQDKMVTGPNQTRVKRQDKTGKHNEKVAGGNGGERRK